VSNDEDDIDLDQSGGNDNDMDDDDEDEISPGKKAAKRKVICTGYFWLGSDELIAFS
jgi:hypothetical protein